MPGKSKRKKLRYSASKQNVTIQKPAVTGTAAATTASAPIAGTAKTAPVKSSPATAKTPIAQYTPELLKHVGTELKISIALSAAILVVIVALAFIIH